uniref:Uncharacterized protein n=1 Tax=Timema monikensis TaxID=170555 RepID=A0A7R9E284_9NEOP|nr:unnamed protein product [Timema monikensis]
MKKEQSYGLVVDVSNDTSKGTNLGDGGTVKKVKLLPPYGGWGWAIAFGMSLSTVKPHRIIEEGNAALSPKEVPACHEVRIVGQGDYNVLLLKLNKLGTVQRTKGYRLKTQMVVSENIIYARALMVTGMDVDDSESPVI